MQIGAQILVRRVVGIFHQLTDLICSSNPELLANPFKLRTLPQGRECGLIRKILHGGVAAVAPTSPNSYLERLEGFRASAHDCPIVRGCNEKPPWNAAAARYAPRLHVRPHQKPISLSGTICLAKD
jgi:hypothetical protein